MPRIFQQLSKRERSIFIGAAAAVVLLILYQFAYNPLCDQLADAQTKRDKCREALGAMKLEVGQQAQLAPKWRQMLDSGLKSDAQEAESQVLHALDDWAQQCRVKLSVMRSDRGQENAANAGKKRLPEIALHATGEGTMESMGRLLWRMQSATMPIRVTKMQANTPKEGMDYLSFTLDLSTIYAPAPRSASQPAGGAGTGPVSSSGVADVSPVSSSPSRGREQPDENHGQDVHAATLPAAVSPSSTSPSAAPAPASQATPASGGTGVPPVSSSAGSVRNDPEETHGRDAHATTQPAAWGLSPAVNGPAGLAGGQ
jgi:hypothetical protein